MRKVAVVTGAARGVGRSIARRLAQDGFIVVLSYLSEAAEANGLTAAIIRMGGDARAVKADVANQFWVKSFFDETLRSFGRIDLVVNTSLIPSLAHSREGGTLEEAVATNRRGAYLVLTQAARLVADGGSIVVVSDRAAFATSHPPHASCMASDVRMEGYLYELASELRDRDVSVNIIECLPDRAGFSLESETEVQNIYVGKHAHLVGQEQPVDIAGVVSFLAGPDGHLVTSQVLCASDCAA